MNDQRQANQLKKIGLVDSGLGGLTILQKLVSVFPAQYLYLADTKNLPYGQKSADQLIQIGIRNIDFLASHDVDTVIIACHTLSALAFKILQSTYPHIFFVGMGDSVVQRAYKVTHSGKIGIIATVPTIQSHTLKKALLQQEIALQIFEQSCPELVPAIELLPINWNRINVCLQEYLNPLLQKHIDTLILGCTHYSLIKDLIAQKAPHIRLVSADEEIEKFFNAQQPKNSFSSTVSFFVTGDEKEFFSKLPFYFDGGLAQAKNDLSCFF